MVDMRRLRQIADAHGLVVVEDSAHAIESRRDGLRPSALAHAGCFSFYATKNLTSGEGGAITTNDDALAEHLRKARLHGMSKSAADRYVAARYQHYDMELLGWKYNMDNIHAALLVHQLAGIEERLRRREAICRRYEEAFRAVDGIRYPAVRDDSRSARHLFTIWVDPRRRDEVMWELQQRGVGVAVNFRAIHLMQYYRETFGYRRGMFPNAEHIGDATITLPLYPKLTDEQVGYVIDSVIAVAGT
jgi:UDP-4-amino-4-deoxy-L-arabinose-oxoglutarate aminotransferase